MSAQLKLDQAGLSAGVAGFARTDGLATGAVVTVTNVGGGATTRVQLLAVAESDTSAVATLVQTGPQVWQFTPLASRYGSYRIELIVDEGLPTESRQRRIFGIRLPNSGLLIPAWNEVADPTGSLANQGVAVVDASENNEPDTSYPSGDPRGSFKALYDALVEVDSLTGLSHPLDPGSEWRFFDDFDQPLDTTLKWVKTGTGSVSVAGVLGSPGAGYGMLTATCDSGQTLFLHLGTAPIVGGNGMQPTLRTRVQASALNTVAPFYISLQSGNVYIKASLGSATGWALACRSVAGGSSSFADNLGAFAINTWYDVMVTFDGSVASLYVDGMLLGTVSVAGALPEGSEFMAPSISFTGLSGTGNTLYVDYIDVRGFRL